MRSSRIVRSSRAIWCGRSREVRRGRFGEGGAARRPRACPPRPDAPSPTRTQRPPTATLRAHLPPTTRAGTLRRRQNDHERHTCARRGSNAHRHDASSISDDVALPRANFALPRSASTHTRTRYHHWLAQHGREASRDEILGAFRASSRLAFIRMADGVVALDNTLESMKGQGRPRGDRWKVAVREDVLKIGEDELSYTCQLFCPCSADDQAIVVPENVDAIPPRPSVAPMRAWGCWRIASDTAPRPVPPAPRSPPCRHSCLRSGPVPRPRARIRPERIGPHAERSGRRRVRHLALV